MPSSKRGNSPQSAVPVLTAFAHAINADIMVCAEAHTSPTNIAASSASSCHPAVLYTSDSLSSDCDLFRLKSPIREEGKVEEEEEEGKEEEEEEEGGKLTTRRRRGGEIMTINTRYRC